VDTARKSVKRMMVEEEKQKNGKKKATEIQSRIRWPTGMGGQGKRLKGKGIGGVEGSSMYEEFEVLVRKTSLKRSRPATMTLYHPYSANRKGTYSVAFKSPRKKGSGGMDY